MNNRLLLAAVKTVLLAAAVVTVAHAGDSAADQSTAEVRPTGGHGGGIFITAWDIDGDGKVSRAEYDAARTQRFAQADRNDDDALDTDEYVDEYAVRLDHQIVDARKSHLGQTHTRFRALDKEGDGFISRAEYDASGERAFAHLDHDKDGRIAATDPDSGKDMTRASTAAEGSKRASGQPARERRVLWMPSTHTRAGFLELYDADGDDIMTRTQYDAQRAAVFTATDGNGDGKLDLGEYVAEFSSRLDREIVDTRKAQLQQGRVRFESIDGDENGRISREEYLAMSARMFDRLDTDKDGAVAESDPPPPAQERRSARRQ